MCLHVQVMTLGSVRVAVLADKLPTASPVVNVLDITLNVSMPAHRVCLHIPCALVEASICTQNAICKHWHINMYSHEDVRV